MTRVFSFILTLLVLSTAWAFTLPEHARVTLISESGVVLGVGEITNGDLSLTLEAGANGFVTLLLEGVDGIVSLEGVVTAGGQVLLTSKGEFEDLVATVEAAGGEAMVAFEARIAQGVDDVSNLTDEAQAGIDGAIENFGAATDAAAEGRANAGAAGAAGETRTGVDVDAEAEGRIAVGADNSEDGRAEAEGSVEVGVGIGVGVGTD
ncbi:MAG: hypothetical protein WD273_01195 [Trueperaceae bacterium]